MPFAITFCSKTYSASYGASLLGFLLQLTIPEHCSETCAPVVVWHPLSSSKSIVMKSQYSPIQYCHSVGTTKVTQMPRRKCAAQRVNSAGREASPALSTPQKKPQLQVEDGHGEDGWRVREGGVPGQGEGGETDRPGRGGGTGQGTILSPVSG